jgi:hypothetical protein
MMRRLILGMTVLGALACVLPGVVAQQAKPAKPPKGKDLDASQLPPGTFTGKLVSVPDSDRMFTVEVAYQEVVPNPNFTGDPGILGAYQAVLRIQSNMARSRNPGALMGQLQVAVLNLQQRIARAQQNSIRVVNAKQKIDFQAEENVKVRTATLPSAFDDKGNIKKYTPAELRELKGKDSHLAGYESSVENLKPGQTVQVVLKHHHPKPAGPSPSQKDLDKDAEKEKAKEGVAEKKMQAQVIIIMDDGGSGDGTPTRSKKGNN